VLGFRRGLSTSAKNDGSISSRARLINECQKDETKERKREETAHSAPVAEHFKTKKKTTPKQMENKRIKVQPFCRALRPMLPFLMTPSLHRGVKRVHNCTSSFYAPVCPQPHCLLDRLVSKQMTVQTTQAEQPTGNDALLP